MAHLSPGLLEGPAYPHGLLGELLGSQVSPGPHRQSKDVISLPRSPSGEGFAALH